MLRGVSDCSFSHDSFLPMTRLLPWDMYAGLLVECTDHLVTHLDKANIFDVLSRAVFFSEDILIKATRDFIRHDPDVLKDPREADLSSLLQGALIEILKDDELEIDEVSDGLCFVIMFSLFPLLHIKKAMMLSPHLYDRLID